jgi:general secretion pathway protein I
MKITQRGFTLIETLVALVIVAAAIVSASMSWSGTFMRIRKAGIAYDVATLLERKMVEIEAQYANKPVGEIPKEDGEDFGEDYPQYRWEMKSQDLKFPDLSPLLVGQGPDGAPEALLSMIKQMTEFFGTVVKEVRVTVFVKAPNGRETQFSASQYFVDHQTNPSFLGGGAAAPAPQGNGP